MAKDYQVLKIVELVKPSDQGGVERFYRHTIRTTGGTVLSVDVGEKDWTPDKSAKLLAAAAQNADAILKS